MCQCLQTEAQILTAIVDRDDDGQVHVTFPPKSDKLAVYAVRRRSELKESNLGLYAFGRLW